MNIKYIRGTELQKLLNEDTSVLIDTLPEDHFDKVHLAGALNACVYTVAFLDQLTEVAADKNETVVLYGAGERSQDAVVAAEKMARAGYTDIYVLKGGLEEWRKLGYPLAGNATGEEDISPTFLKLEDGAFTMDCGQSSIEWAGRNQNSTHFGTVPCIEGDINIAGSTVTGNLSVNMDGIKNINLAGDELQPILEAHLKSDDFFFVERFKTAKLRINAGEITQTPYLTSSNCTIQGELTLRGITRELTFEATLTTDPDGDLLLEAHFDLDRTKWKIIYGSARFFEFLGMHQVFDDISLQLRLRLHKDDK